VQSLSGRNFLPLSKQDVLRRLAVFRGGFTRAAVQQLVDQTQSALRLLNFLVDAYWLKIYPLKYLLTSAGIRNTNIHNALLDLLAKSSRVQRLLHSQRKLRHPLR
jgi:hypothetical protein